MAQFKTLASHLEATADQFEREQSAYFRTALGDGPVGEEILGAVVQMTRGLLKSGTGMIRAPLSGFPETLLGQFLTKQGPPGRLDAQVELEIARSFALHTDEMAQRCLDVARLALETLPGEAVLRFLSRLGRCYIAGFFPEAVVMCRAVLENAVEEKFARTREPLPVPSSGKSTMRAKLNRAKELGWLTRRQTGDAMSIWERGSKTVHKDPQVTKAVLDTIQVTMTLLGALHSDVE